MEINKQQAKVILGLIESNKQIIQFLPEDMKESISEQIIAKVGLFTLYELEKKLQEFVQQN